MPTKISVLIEFVLPKNIVCCRPAVDLVWSYGRELRARYLKPLETLDPGCKAPMVGSEEAGLYMRGMVLRNAGTHYVN